MSLRRWRELAPYAIVAAFLVGLAVVVADDWVWTGDTLTVRNGAAGIVKCFREGHLSSCDAHNPAFFDVGPLPLFQYLPGIVFYELGIAGDEALHWFAWLSFAAFGGTLALYWQVSARTGSSALSPILLVTALTGPLLWYSHAAFGEALAAFLAVLYLSAILTRRSGLVIAATLWMAALTKEVALPFLLALALIAYYGRRDMPRPTRGETVGLAVGALAALLTTALFNVFRYGGPSNDVYLSAAARVPDLGRRAEFFAGLWLSPNGGMAWFWPSATFLLVAAALFGWGARTGQPSRRWPAAAVVLVIVGLTAGFATITNPFGWYAWGPRYLIPWIPCLVLLVVVLYRERFEALCRALVSSRKRWVASSALLSAVSLPQLGAILQDRDDLFAWLFSATKGCPRDITVLDGADRYYECLSHQAWGRFPVLVRTYEGFASLEGAIYSCAFVASIAALLWLAKLRMEPAGIEPATSCLQSRRSPN